MPRRAPKKPSPELDLSAHFLVLTEDPVFREGTGFRTTPLDPRQLFPGCLPGAPVELEVGSGKGLFLTTAAAAAPERCFLGVEISHGYAKMTAGRLARQGAANARIIAGDGNILVRNLFPDACLDAIHVYFPDPWWKARHRKRRVLSDMFLAHAGRVLVPGGVLHVWTDVEEYFHEAMGAAAATGLFAPPADVPQRHAEHDLDYRTHFERRTRLAGEPVWRAALERNASPPRESRLPSPAVPQADEA